MQGRAILIFGEFVSLAVDNNPAIGDAVRGSPKQRAERPAIFDVPLHVVEAEYNTIPRPRAVGNVEGHQQPGIIGNAGYKQIAM